MTAAELRAAVASGRCAWDEVTLTLERAHVPLAERIEILAGRAELRPYAAMMIAELVETGMVPLEAIEIHQQAADTHFLGTRTRSRGIFSDHDAS